MNPEHTNSAGDDSKRWLMCPVCLEANPRGKEFCHHCWGARLSPGPVLTMSELENLRNTELRRRRSKNFVKKSLKIAIPSVVVLIPIILTLYFWTDILVKPNQEINSGSPDGAWTMFGRDFGHAGSAGPNETLPEGTLKWSFSTAAAISSSPVVVDDTVYIGSRDYNLYAVDIDTGIEKWRHQAESWIESSPAIVDGTVYIGSNDGRLYSLDAETGKIRWTFQSGMVVKSSPAYADGRIYFGNGNYNIYCVDAESGELIWEYLTDGPIFHGPVVANGIVYVGTYGDYTHALDAVTGRLRVRYDVYGTAYGPPAVQGDMVYVVNSKGFLFVFDGSARSWPQEHPARLLLLKFYLQSLSIVPPDWLLPPNQSGYRWGAKMSGRLFAFPTIAGDTLYVGSQNALFAVDIADRPAEIWSFKVGGRIKSSPAVAAGIVYAGTENGILHAVDGSTGVEKWRFVTGAGITSSPAVVDGVVYVGSHDGNLYAIE